MYTVLEQQFMTLMPQNIVRLSKAIEKLNENIEKTTTRKSLSDRLSELSKDAFTQVKAKLTSLGGSFTLKKPITLYIDICCNNSIYELEAKKVFLRDNNIIVLADMDEDNEKYILESMNPTYDPSEVWCEGSEWYAEWEGLLELFDEILDA